MGISISMSWFLVVIGIVATTVLGHVVDKIYSRLKGERQSKLK